VLRYLAPTQIRDTGDYKKATNICLRCQIRGLFFDRVNCSLNGNLLLSRFRDLPQIRREPIPFPPSLTSIPLPVASEGSPRYRGNQPPPRSAVSGTTKSNKALSETAGSFVLGGQSRLVYLLEIDCPEMVVLFPKPRQLCLRYLFL
jgi:hypothetical protein